MKLKPGIHTYYLRRADLPTILEIDNLVFIDSWTEDEFLERLRQQEVLAMCIRLDHKIVGFLIYRIERTAYRILRIAVDPAARRQGIGRMLVKKVKARLFGKRNRLTVMVPEVNMSALKFFQACGFRGVCVERNSEGCDDFQLEYVFV